MKWLILSALFILTACSAECNNDSDCFPQECCHPTTCGTEKPDCEGVFCTQNCEPDTMDCGQGQCACVEGKCVVEWN